MNDKNNIKLKIIKILQENSKGLHILGISELVRAHRHTVTKYIHELIGAGIVYQRHIGTVKLCYLSPDFKSKLKRLEK